VNAFGETDIVGQFQPFEWGWDGFRPPSVLRAIQKELGNTGQWISKRKPTSPPKKFQHSMLLVHFCEFCGPEVGAFFIFFEVVKIAHGAVGTLAPIFSEPSHKLNSNFAQS
jgi:hypothetical protein